MFQTVSGNSPGIGAQPEDDTDVLENLPTGGEIDWEAEEAKTEELRSQGVQNLAQNSHVRNSAFLANRNYAGFDQELMDNQFPPGDGWSTRMVEGDSYSLGGAGGQNNAIVCFNNQTGELYVSFQGTASLGQVWEDLDQASSNFSEFGGLEVADGFVDGYNRLVSGKGSAPGLYDVIDSMTEGYDGDIRTNVTGHSYGGAMADLFFQYTGDGDEPLINKYGGYDDSNLVTFGGAHPFVEGQELDMPANTFVFINPGDPVPVSQNIGHELFPTLFPNKYQMYSNGLEQFFTKEYSQGDNAWAAFTDLLDEAGETWFTSTEGIDPTAPRPENLNQHSMDLYLEYLAESAGAARDENGNIDIDAWYQGTGEDGQPFPEDDNSTFEWYGGGQPMDQGQWDWQDDSPNAAKELMVGSGMDRDTAEKIGNVWGHFEDFFSDRLFTGENVHGYLDVMKSAQALRSYVKWKMGEREVMTEGERYMITFAEDLEKGGLSRAFRGMIGRFMKGSDKKYIASAGEFISLSLSDMIGSVFKTMGTLLTSFGEGVISQTQAIGGEMAELFGEVMPESLQLVIKTMGGIISGAAEAGMKVMKVTGKFLLDVNKMNRVVKGIVAKGADAPAYWNQLTKARFDEASGKMLMPDGSEANMLLDADGEILEDAKVFNDYVVRTGAWREWGLEATEWAKGKLYYDEWGELLEEPIAYITTGVGNAVDAASEFAGQVVELTDEYVASALKSIGMDASPEAIEALRTQFLEAGAEMVDGMVASLRLIEGLQSLGRGVGNLVKWTAAGGAAVGNAVAAGGKQLAETIAKHMEFAMAAGFLIYDAITSGGEMDLTKEEFAKMFPGNVDDMDDEAWEDFALAWTGTGIVLIGATGTALTALGASIAWVGTAIGTESALGAGLATAGTMFGSAGSLFAGAAEVLGPVGLMVMAGIGLYEVWDFSEEYGLGGVASQEQVTELHQKWFKPNDIGDDEDWPVMDPFASSYGTDTHGFLDPRRISNEQYAEMDEHFVNEEWGYAYEYTNDIDATNDWDWENAAIGAAAGILLGPGGMLLGGLLGGTAKSTATSASHIFGGTPVYDGVIGSHQEGDLHRISTWEEYYQFLADPNKPWYMTGWMSHFDMRDYDPDSDEPAKLMNYEDNPEYFEADADGNYAWMTYHSQFGLSDKELIGFWQKRPDSWWANQNDGYQQYLKQDGTASFSDWRESQLADNHANSTISDRNDMFSYMNQPWVMDQMYQMYQEHVGNTWNSETKTWEGDGVARLDGDMDFTSWLQDENLGGRYSMEPGPTATANPRIYDGNKTLQQLNYEQSMHIAMTFGMQEGSPGMEALKATVGELSENAWVTEEELAAMAEDDPDAVWEMLGNVDVDDDLIKNFSEIKKLDPDQQFTPEQWMNFTLRGGGAEVDPEIQAYLEGIDYAASPEVFIAHGDMLEMQMSFAGHLLELYGPGGTTDNLITAKDIALLLVINFGWKNVDEQFKGLFTEYERESFEAGTSGYSSATDGYLSSMSGDGTLQIDWSVVTMESGLQLSPSMLATQWLNEAGANAGTAADNYQTYQEVYVTNTVKVAHPDWTEEQVSGAWDHWHQYSVNPSEETQAAGAQGYGFYTFMENSYPDEDVDYHEPSTWQTENLPDPADQDQGAWWDENTFLPPDEDPDETEESPIDEEQSGTHGSSDPTESGEGKDHEDEGGEDGEDEDDNWFQDLLDSYGDEYGEDYNSYYEPSGMNAFDDKDDENDQYGIGKRKVNADAFATEFWREVKRIKTENGSVTRADVMNEFKQMQEAVILMS